MENVSLIGIDLSKSVFQLHAVNHTGRCLLKRRLQRREVIGFVEKLSRGCVIAMEACGASHYWAREFTKRGFEVKLISPQHVKPFVKSQKNDRNDAEAICEAAIRPSMRFVGVKTADQQDVQCIHRARERVMAARVALINQMRGFLQEYGIVVPKGVATFKQAMITIADDNREKLSLQMQVLIAELQKELRMHEEQLDIFNRKLAEVARENPAARRLMTLQGVGVLTATAAITVGDPKVFKNGRNYSAWLGLVPSQHSTAGKSTLGGITKNGDVYLRTLLIHGARATLRHCVNKHDTRSLWIKSLQERRGFNRAAVALANKNARIIWALLTSRSEYKALPKAA